jgi:predicted TIM-barrel fold metal-dependent hydrolase
MEQMTSKQFGLYVEMMESDEMVCFSSDYPHFDFDAPERVIPPGLDKALARKILHDNAAAFYGLTD